MGGTAPIGTSPVEQLEAAALMAIALGFPVSAGLTWLAFLGTPGWVAMIVLAPALNWALIALMLATVLVRILRVRGKSPQ